MKNPGQPLCENLAILTGSELKEGLSGVEYEKEERR